ncbi:acyl carrier protein [Parabacteroides distasonis]|uniref:acyl carrier protein n=1 Tax=Parabacteroides distasonis TaxID=823 RepID=UPI00189E4915|nr:acyl carrier protein [Parabacteroides distasonis]MDB9152997.1 acyl carrier protein [Parabacteroides distasonis]MDB9157678.1 acyl carrier protein [Parabacteroides distasonis]MDB9166543.1 acyl carrier protein [Parabacteroides distasonis]MDB9170962.1 acyl carrier protein [Parabacteroides distasonis]MDB9195695.1 acyl carrier protein [Parabacteroides distasonis]
MTLEDFVKRFAEEFDDTDSSLFTADANFHEFEEWSSLAALSIIAMVDEEFDKSITGADIRSCKTINELYELIQSK